MPIAADANITQDILAQLRTIPTHLHGVYSVLDRPCRITSRNGPLEELIAFVKSNGRICVDTLTGAVVKISQCIVDHTVPVNSSLVAFGRCVHAFAVHHPFYSVNSGYAVRGAMCDEIRRDLLEIDPALDEYPASAFWNDLAARFLNGDFATEHMRRDYHVTNGVNQAFG